VTMPGRIMTAVYLSVIVLGLLIGCLAHWPD
jgi:hypothetical protein